MIDVKGEAVIDDAGTAVLAEMLMVDAVATRPEGVRTTSSIRNVVGDGSGRVASTRSAGTFCCWGLARRRDWQPGSLLGDGSPTGVGGPGVSVTRS